jgi:hypothetical protein
MLHAPALRAFALVLVAAQDASPPPALELLDHGRLAGELKAIAGAHPDVAQIQKLGDSRAGRAIEGLRLAGAGAAAEPARPAILLVANVDGARVYSSAVALQHARALAQGYASDEKVRTLLDTTTVFVVPRANPDAAEARFAPPRQEQRASGTGVDDDRDGRMGEDPPSDLDGDGLVTWIRVKDPDGEWREDPTDARALVKAERVKGEAGVYRLWPEGRDLDKDERLAEDAPLDARVDRNFPAGWEAHAKEAGLFPTDEPETRALCDFVLAHPELALVVLYDAEDSLVAEIKGVGEEPQGRRGLAPEGVLESDAKLLGELGKRYRKLTEGAAKSEAGDRGTFARWSYEQRGLLVLATALWDVPLEEKKDDKKAEKKAGETPEGAETKQEGAAESEPRAGEQAGPKEPAARPGDERRGKEAKEDDEPKPSDDAKRLKWIDASGPDEAWRFRPWTPYVHPELGPVEIGGLAPYARLEPPASESGAIAARHLEWFLTLGALLPRVRLAECTRERLGENLWRVTAVLQNDAYLPLQSRSARRAEAIRPAKVTLRLAEAGRRLGGPVREFVDDLAGSGGRRELTWLVQGPDAMEIAVEVESANAGTARRVAEEKKR